MPLWLKLASTAFMTVLPVYLAYYEHINHMFGSSDHAAQTWLTPHVWFGALLLGLVLLVFLPTHLRLRRLLPPAPWRR